MVNETLSVLHGDLEEPRMQQSSPYNNFLGLNNNNVYSVNANLSDSSFDETDRSEEYPIDLEMDGSHDAQNIAVPMTAAVSNALQYIPACQACFINSANQNLGLSSQTAISSVPNFTFTTPTQSTMYSPPLMSSNQGYQFQRAVPQTFSPTGCTPWQHSVPNRVPWMGQSVGLTVSSQGVSIFTAPLCSRSQTSWTSMSPQVTTTQDPSPSCSQIPRRPKRGATQNLEYLSPTNKVHLTERMIAEHMRELSINSIVNPPGQDGIRQEGCGSQQRFCQFSKASPCISQQSGPDIASRGLSQEVQWQAFRDLEEKLDVSDDESPVKKESKLKKTEPKIVFLEKLPQQPSSGAIPQKILDAIQKPSLELVLWQPPSDVVKEAIDRENDREKKLTQGSQERKNSMAESREDDNTMELDLCEGDDLML